MCVCVASRVCTCFSSLALVASLATTRAREVKLDQFAARRLVRWFLMPDARREKNSSLVGWFALRFSSVCVCMRSYIWMCVCVCGSAAATRLYDTLPTYTHPYTYLTQCAMCVWRLALVWSGLAATTTSMAVYRGSEARQISFRFSEDTSHLRRPLLETHLRAQPCACVPSLYTIPHTECVCVLSFRSIILHANLHTLIRKALNKRD